MKLTNGMKRKRTKDSSSISVNSSRLYDFVCLKVWDVDVFVSLGVLTFFHFIFYLLTFNFYL